MSKERRGYTVVFGGSIAHRRIGAPWLRSSERSTGLSTGGNARKKIGGNV
jgi:hypothetical protein